MTCGNPLTDPLPTEGEFCYSWPAPDLDDLRESAPVNARFHLIAGNCASVLEVVAVGVECGFGQDNSN